MWAGTPSLIYFLIKVYILRVDVAAFIRHVRFSNEEEMMSVPGQLCIVSNDFAYYMGLA